MPSEGFGRMNGSAGFAASLVRVTTVSLVFVTVTPSSRNDGLPAMALHALEREDDVVGRHRRAVGERVLSVEGEGEGLVVGRLFVGREARDRLRDVAAVEGEQRLVERVVDDRSGQLERASPGRRS